uniref:protein dispatched homolog 1-like n=1 Tax=Myxine glutinosa TaxID=7769 RepID=UPI00358DEB01
MPSDHLQAPAYPPPHGFFSPNPPPLSILPIALLSAISNRFFVFHVYIVFLFAHIYPPPPSLAFSSYAELIAEWPLAVLVACTSIITICTLLAVLVPELPDFSDPLLGFEPRGTEISQRLVTWNNMVKNTGYMATLSNLPFRYAEQLARRRAQLHHHWPEDHERREVPAVNMEAAREENEVNGAGFVPWHANVEWDFRSDGFFCDAPDEKYPRLVFAAADGGSLWSVTALKSMCQIYERKVQSHASYSELCHHASARRCCPAWSPGSYVAALFNRSGCKDITERDLSAALRLLRACAPLYHNGTLEPGCWNFATGRRKRGRCRLVPRHCVRRNAVYHMLHFLFDNDFLAEKPLLSAVPYLRYAMVFAPTAKGEGMMELYRDQLENWNLTDGLTRVAGIEFGIKHILFQDYLLTDTMYPAIAMVVVLVVMCLYTGSAFITLMTMFAMVSSLILAYFVYRLLLGFEFFPFMNLTSLVVLVGIGADDAFVLCDVWHQAGIDASSAPGEEVSLLRRVRVTLRHAALSMFITSFTTAAAFYANYISSITAVRCFGVYAGTAILANFALMVSWLPAVVVLQHRYLTEITPPSPLTITCEGKSVVAAAWRQMAAVRVTISRLARCLFRRLLPQAVFALRHIWLCLFFALAIAGAYAVFIDPGIRLPSLELTEFRVFHPSHPFERYDTELRQLFAFERSGRVGHGSSSGPSGDLALPVTLVWGILPIDLGDPLNPRDRGALTLDLEFDASSPEAQQWLLGFCERLRKQSFYLPRDGDKGFSGCFMGAFKRWMETEAEATENNNCQEGDGSMTLEPCCSGQVFPYQRVVFEHCLKRAVLQLEHRYRVPLDSRSPGPRFDINDTLQAVLVEFLTTQPFTLAYGPMAQFYRHLNNCLTSELTSAPQGLRQAWFVTSLEYYDLQASLWAGCLISLGLAAGLAFAVMLATTHSPLISLHALLSIGSAIAVTTGILATLGWELNVLESATVSVAVGLSVDFALHYGIAYRLAPAGGRRERVTFSLDRMGSAVSMAALTTFLAGATMIPSTVLAYTQLGTFLMLVMAVSWAYATFFFQSLCCCMGPLGEVQASVGILIPSTSSASCMHSSQCSCVPIPSSSHILPCHSSPWCTSLVNACSGQKPHLLPSLEEHKL